MPETRAPETRAPETRPVALVTGASGGMGGEIVRDLASTHRVIAVGRDAGALEALAAETGCETAVVELTDHAAVAELASSLDRLDVLVNAAAVGRHIRVDDAEPADWNEQFSVNVLAPAELTRRTLPLLRETAGTIVFIGSGASTSPVPGSAVYTATKHALRGLADVLRIDEEPHFVRVVTVAPGPTDTAMLHELIPADDYRPELYIKPKSVADAVRFAVDAPADVQLTDIAVRPRRELSRI